MMPLPRVNKHQETKFSIRFIKWIEQHGPAFPCSIELKDTRGKSSLPFREIKDKQISYGMRIKGEKGVLIRVEALFEGMPDYIWCINMPAYVVIKYPHSFSLIDVETLLLEKKRSKRRSLTEARSREISNLTIELK